MQEFEELKLDNQLCFSMYAASREIIKMYKDLLEPFKLTYTQYIAMLVIWEEAPITVKRLGERLLLDSGTLSPLLKKLIAMELIEKHRDPDDDRSVIVTLTTAGKSMRDKIRTVPVALYESLAIRHSDEQLLQLKQSVDGFLGKTQ